MANDTIPCPAPEEPSQSDRIEGKLDRALNLLHCLSQEVLAKHEEDRIRDRRIEVLEHRLGLIPLELPKEGNGRVT